MSPPGVLTKIRSLSCVKWAPPAPRAGKIRFASPPSAEIQTRSAFAVWPPSNSLFSRSYALPRNTTILLPSGDHAGSLYTPIDFDNCCGAPPLDATFHNSPPSFDHVTYAIDLPSGDHAG